MSVLKDFFFSSSSSLNANNLVSRTFVIFVKKVFMLKAERCESAERGKGELSVRFKRCLQVCLPENWQASIKKKEKKSVYRCCCQTSAYYVCVFG